MHVQAAIEAPRVKTGSPGFVVDVENRIDREVFAALERRGHQFNFSAIGRTGSAVAKASWSMPTRVPLWAGPTRAATAMPSVGKW